MTKEERLEFCSICTNRKMDWETGLQCNLTGKPADFEDSCPSFNLDEEEQAYVTKRKMAAIGDNSIGHSVDFSKNKQQGALIFWVGILLTTLSLAAADEVGFVVVTFGAIVYGAIQYLRGVEQEKVFKASNNKDEN